MLRNCWHFWIWSCFKFLGLPFLFENILHGNGASKSKNDWKIGETLPPVQGLSDCGVICSLLISPSEFSRDCERLECLKFRLMTIYSRHDASAGDRQSSHCGWWLLLESTSCQGTGNSRPSKFARWNSQRSMVSYISMTSQSCNSAHSLKSDQAKYLTAGNEAVYIICIAVCMSYWKVDRSLDSCCSPKFWTKLLFAVLPPPTRMTENVRTQKCNDRIVVFRRRFDVGDVICRWIRVAFGVVN